MSVPLTIERVPEGAVEVVVVSGSLDGHSFVRLERELEELIAAGRHRLVIDLSALRYIASAGVGVIIGSRQRCRDRGGSLQMTGIVGMVAEVFEVLGLKAVLPVHRDRASAVAAAAA